MPDPRALLVSVKPTYAEMLLSGKKTVELRRTRPQAAPGCSVLIYASSPRMEMVGTARVASIDTGDLDQMWEQFGPRTGVNRATYDDYFAGSQVAVAIALADIRALERGVPLSELRQRVRGFRPPQSFRYLQPSQAAAVT